MSTTSRFNSIFLFTFQLIMTVILGLFTNYSVDNYIFQWNSVIPIALQAFLGYGFIMAFLKQHSWSPLGFTIYIIISTVQYSMLWEIFWNSVANNSWSSIGKITINQKIIINGLYASISVLISYGSVLGRIGIVEIIVIIIVHIVGYSANNYLCLVSNMLKCYDVGRGMTVHAYAGFFSLGLLLLLSKQKYTNSKRNGSSYIGNILNLLGVMFIWICWPSFNTYYIGEYGVEYTNIAIANTVFTLIGSTVGGFIVSGFLRQRLNIQDIVNSIVSGGVVISSSVIFLQNPGGAIACGFISSCVTIIGIKLFPSLYDIRGSFVTHGIIGFLSGVLSSILILIYGTLFNIGSFQYPKTQFERSIFQQAGYQMICNGISIGMGFVSGLISGTCILKISNYRKDQLFNDATFWDVDYEEMNLFQVQMTELSRNKSYQQRQFLKSSLIH